MTINEITKKTHQAAIELLSRRCRDGKGKCLPIDCRPESIEDALAIHQAMVELRADDVGAWKCLLPLGEDKIIVAPIFSDTIQYGNSCELFSQKNVDKKNIARVEPEIAFILGKDLPAQSNGYNEQEINDAVIRCHMALELMQNRFEDNSTVSFYEKLADGLVNQGLYIGAEIDKSVAFVANKIDIKFEQSINTQSFAGSHPNSLPQNPLYWLINFMSKRGISFFKGQAIITGSYAGVVDLAFGKKTTISYENIGRYEVIFHEK
jgi:2-keto-4-pentenoate hydratase